MLNDNYKTLPVAKRTRNQVDKMYRLYHEEIKRQRKLEGGNPTKKLDENGRNLLRFSGGTNVCDMGLESSHGDEKAVEKESLEPVKVNDSDDDVVFEAERDADGYDFQGRETVTIEDDDECGIGGIDGGLEEREMTMPHINGFRVKIEEVELNGGSFGVSSDLLCNGRQERCNGENLDGKQFGAASKRWENEGMSSSRMRRSVVVAGRTRSRLKLKESWICEMEKDEESDHDRDVDADVDCDNSEVDLEEETSLSSEDSDNSEDDHREKSTNCDIVENMSVEEKEEEDKEDKEEEIFIHGTSLSDDIDIEQNDSVKGNTKLECVARRTRSRCNMESGKQIMENGTTGSPYAKRTTKYENDVEILASDVSDDDHGPAVKSFKTRKKSEKGKKSKGRKGHHFFKDHEVEKILAASILNKAEGSMLDDYLPELPTEEKLPLKFTFGIEESPPPEKTEEEKEMERLWEELALGLNKNDVDDAPMGESDSHTACEIDQATLCRKGKHEYILDEEIGIKCKYCSFVDVEIRYYVPPLVKQPLRKSERSYDWMEDRTFDEFQYHGFDFDSQSTSNSSSDLHGTVWNIVPGIRKGLHAHQIEGFEFLWKNIAGGTDLEKLKEPTSYIGGSGCVISHAPGTGKTRLAITFLQSYVKLYPNCRPMIIAPLGTLHIWETEFERWAAEVPFYSLCEEKLTGNESSAVLSMLAPGKRRNNTVRLIKLYSWKMRGGVLVLSYRLFEELTGRCDSVWGALLELPGLLILDEGHTPRNSSSLIWQALSKIQTEKRVILSGTPFQNNFDELYNILCLVRPKFADQIPSKRPRGRPPKKSRARDNWASMTNGIVSDDEVKPERVEEVRKMIAPFVHVHKGSILQDRLPGLRDSVVFLEPSGVQKHLLDIITRMIMTRHSLDLEHAVSMVSVHPNLLCLKESNRKCLKESIRTSKLNVDWSKLEDLRLDPKAGVKTKFLTELIRLSYVLNEKVLVFSQYIVTLDLIIEQLEGKFNWVLGREVLRMDGEHDLKHRHWAMNHFNDPKSSSRVMLASTKACCEGISLVGASRVVLLDVVWNPSVERQAISRAYRLGQQKVVYVYHLPTSGTMEEEKYRRQAEKDLLSELVFYSEDGAAANQKFPSTLLEEEKDKLLEQMVEGEKLKCIFNKIMYQPKKCKLVGTFGLE